MVSDIADVVVIGAGGAGLAAAIVAAELGRRVILLEKNDFVGGTTIHSMAGISATSTPHQIREGIKDTPDEHFRDVGRFNDRVAEELPHTENNLALRRMLVDNVNDSLRWLMAIGVEFFGPLPEPPHSKPRMHNVLPNSRAYGYFLEKRARALGVDVRTGVRAKRLVSDGDGRVMAVECIAQDGSLRQIEARGGIILTTGDYSGSAELKRQLTTEADAAIPAINPASTGDGHAMAVALGARITNGHLVQTLVRFAAPPRTWVHALPPWPFLTRFMSWAMKHLPPWLLRPVIMRFLTTMLSLSPELFRAGAILVNANGGRFTDETSRTVYAIARQPGQIAYVILDGKIGRKFSVYPNFVSTAPGVAYAYLPDYIRSRPDVARAALSIEELARAIGIAPAALRETITARNAALAADPAQPFQPLDEPPFYALGPMRSHVALTDGGLAIDENFAVLGADGRPIAGLYAAGSAGQGGALLDGHGHHLGWAFTSGPAGGPPSRVSREH